MVISRPDRVFGSLRGWKDFTISSQHIAVLENRTDGLVASSPSLDLRNRFDFFFSKNSMLSAPTILNGIVPDLSNQRL